MRFRSFKPPPRRGPRLHLAALGVGLIALLLAADALARPGGGDTFSGGSSSSSGGGGGDAELLFFLIRLAFYYPQLGVPLLIIAVLFFTIKMRKRPAEAWSSQPRLAPPSRHAELEAIAKLDPDFSAIVFEDFVFRLYATAHQARSTPADLDALAPFLSPAVRAELAKRDPVGQTITDVVIGVMKPIAVQLPGDKQDGEVIVRLSFESNMSAGDRSYHVDEVWTLARAAAVRSRPPDAVRAFGCPNCGASYSSSDSQRCDHCGQVVDDGRFDWQVRELRLVQQTPLPPTQRGSVPERGGDMPTIVHPQLRARWQALCAADPALTHDRLRARTLLIYRELNAGWSELDPAKIRPFVSDGMFDYLRYWIDTFKRRQQRNVLKDMRVEKLTVVKVTRDRYYDAITARIHAVGIDYTVDAAGKTLRGSARAPRSYSEYWTLIRGATVRGAPRDEPSCPSCNAPLKISMAGTCEYCGALLTRGDFDWVLSKIEQDESYSG